MKSGIMSLWHWLIERVPIWLYVTGYKRKHGQAWRVEQVQDLSVIGLSKERRAVFNALSWLDQCAPNQFQIVVSCVKIIGCAHYIHEHGVLPMHRFILIKADSAEINDPVILGRIFAAAAHYTQTCHELNRFRGCKIRDLMDKGGSGAYVGP
jgi:hypothetical protein